MLDHRAHLLDEAAFDSAAWRHLPDDPTQGRRSVPAPDERSISRAVRVGPTGVAVSMAAVVTGGGSLSDVTMRPHHRNAWYAGGAAAAGGVAAAWSAFALAHPAES